ncbi:MAG: ribonuclease Z [Desulfobacterales bacterium]|nr:ribonuclease Z [Desulfobacterales bacterium]
MRSLFHPRLINGLFGDPGLFIPFFEKRAVIFDLGDIYSLSAKDLLKISHVFISHTHMDHFVGFDRLIRLFLGREKKLYMYGPEGFLKNVEGKLAGYSWNLVENFNNRFSLHITEVHDNQLITREYRCKNRFTASGKAIKQPFNGTLFKEPALTFSSVVLNHKIPCLGFTIKERFHVNIIKERLTDLGLEIGPWLREFKQALFNYQEPNSKFKVKLGQGNIKKKEFILGDLTNRIAIITPGQKITYITDMLFCESNIKKAVEFARDANHLFIEAAFLEKDKDIAEKKFHLTAKNAGMIAGMARVKQFTLFHFSPRYAGMEDLFQKEALAGYEMIKD